MNRFNRQLWERFLAIAQPYFYPLESGSNKVFLGLVALLLVFLFAAMFVAVSVVCLLGQALFPEFVNNIAAGLVSMLRGIINSPAIAIVALMLIIPFSTFFFFKKQSYPALAGLVIISFIAILFPVSQRFECHN